MDSCLKFSAFGKVNIATQLDESYRLAVHHSDKVSMNQHILACLINCVKFCGVFKLALRGKDESKGSNNPRFFHGLVDLVASLETATVFKGTSKTVQTELLDSMLAVIRGHITEEVKSAKFIAIQADETTACQRRRSWCLC